MEKEILRSTWIMKKLSKCHFLKPTWKEIHSKLYCKIYKYQTKNLDLSRNHPCHDPLFKVRPMINMMDRIFVQRYRCRRDLSFNEACWPYKGRLYFHCYNPSKPSKWYLKLYEVSDARTGYVIGFDVYTGKNKTKFALKANVLDPI